MFYRQECAVVHRLWLYEMAARAQGLMLTSLRNWSKIVGLGRLEKITHKEKKMTKIVGHVLGCIVKGNFIAKWVSAVEKVTKQLSSCASLPHSLWKWETWGRIFDLSTEFLLLVLASRLTWLRKWDMSSLSNVSILLRQKPEIYSGGPWLSAVSSIWIP